METINLILLILNIAMAVWNFKLKNHKTAMFSIFIAGDCFAMFIISVNK